MQTREYCFEPFLLVRQTQERHTPIPHAILFSKRTFIGKLNLEVILDKACSMG